MATGYYSLGLSGYEIDIDPSGEYVYWVYISGQKENKLDIKLSYLKQKAGDYILEQITEESF